jgi:hypothetical protein
VHRSWHVACVKRWPLAVLRWSSATRAHITPPPPPSLLSIAQDNTPARVSVVEIPSRRDIRQKNLFNVSGVVNHHCVPHLSTIFVYHLGVRPLCVPYHSLKGCTSWVLCRGPGWGPCCPHGRSSPSPNSLPWLWGACCHDRPWLTTRCSAGERLSRQCAASHCSTAAASADDETPAS